MRVARTLGCMLGRENKKRGYLYLINLSYSYLNPLYKGVCMNRPWSICVSSICAILLLLTTVYPQSAILDTFSIKLNISRNIIDKFITNVPKIERLSQFPNKIVVEDIVFANPKDTNKSTSSTSELMLSPIEGGIISIIRTGKHPDGTVTGEQTISYLGIIDLGGYAYDQFEQHISAAPGLLGLVPLFQIKKNVDFDISSSLVAFDADLNIIANPSSTNSKWSYNTKTKMKVKKISVDQNLKIECTVSGRIEASSLHPKLSGPAIMVNCSSKSESKLGYVRTYAFLENYKWYFLTKSERTDGKFKELRKIISIE